MPYGGKGDFKGKEGRRPSRNPIDLSYFSPSEEYERTGRKRPRHNCNDCKHFSGKCQLFSLECISMLSRPSFLQRDF